jgi:hypothetical protein
MPTVRVMEKITRIVLMEQFRNPEARDMVLYTIHQPLAFVEEVFKVMIAKGVIRPYDPGILATEYEYPLNAMFLEYTLLRSAGSNTSAIEQRMKDHISFFLSHIENGSSQEGKTA